MPFARGGRWCALVALLVGAGSSCIGSTEPADPLVRFRMESPTCGGPITFEFSIDELVVGTQPLRDQESSSAYETTPGTHAIRARIVNGSFVHDAMVTLQPGDNATIILSPYCS